MLDSSLYAFAYLQNNMPAQTFLFESFSEKRVIFTYHHNYTHIGEFSICNSQALKEESFGPGLGHMLRH